MFIVVSCVVFEVYGLFVGRCLSFVVRCFGVRCRWLVAYCLLLVVWCVLSGLRCVWFVVCSILCFVDVFNV